MVKSAHIYCMYYYFDSSKFNNYFNFTATPNAVAVSQAIDAIKAASLIDNIKTNTRSPEQ